jgi:hypothetical protein
MGHLTGGVDAARLDGNETLHLAAAIDEVALELDTGNLVLLPFLDVEGDVDALLVRGHGDLGGLLGEADVAAVHVVGAQHFDVTGQLLLLVALIAGEVPPGHVVLEGELGQQLLFREDVVADDVDLLDLGRFPFHEGELEVDPVARQRGDDGLDLGGVLAHAVVEIFQPFLEELSTVRSSGSPTRMPEDSRLWVSCSSLMSLLPENSMLEMVGRS